MHYIKRTLILASFIFSGMLFAHPNTENNTEAENCRKDVREQIVKMVQFDLGTDAEFEADVIKVTFTINDNGRIRVERTDGQSDVMKDFVKNALNGKKLKPGTCQPGKAFVARIRFESPAL